MTKKIDQTLGAVCGTATVGPRGQIVIPKDARSRLNLKNGDQFLVIEHFGKLIFIPEKNMRNMIKEITKHLS
jgi:AbrB family looped-hinge helix DNA binding protein